MHTASLDHDTVLHAIELASRAPSIHNSQPWRWYLGARTVHLYADLRRWLPATDSDGRDLVVSCGAALHHLQVALAACGLRSSVHRLPNPDEADHLAAFELHNARTADIDLRLASTIPARRSDRRPFGAWPVPETFLDRLASAAAAHGCVPRRIDGAQEQARVMTAIRTAAWEQPRLPGYDTELALWSGRRASTDGVPAANLPSERANRVPSARRFRPGDIVDRPSVADGAQLLVLGTTSDDRLSQLRAGEALSALLLEATDLGLATCPLSQPLEVGSTRRFLRDRVLDGALCPQMLIRVGWAPSGSALPATPRRSVTETVEGLPD